MTLPIPDFILLLLLVGATSAVFIADLVHRSGTGTAQPATAKPTRARVARKPNAADLLLVDDSAVARAKLRRLFEGAGYSVQLASDGVEAMALLGQGSYAMMVTDLEMPNMDGVTLINECWRQPNTSRMPIIAISAHENLRVKFNACRDICGVHRKPWADDILLSHVAALIGARQASPVAVKSGTPGRRMTGVAA